MFRVILSCLLLAALWSPAGKEWADLLALLYVMFSCVFVTSPYGILCQMWYSIVWSPDFTLLPYYIDCGRPVFPVHGTVVMTIPGKTEYGSMATQACNPGYDLRGTVNISCREDGNWSAPPVNCSLKGLYNS